MEVLEAIAKRRSIRSYRDTEIADSDLKEILEAGCWTPSAVNLQPWYFVALKSKEQKERMLQVMGVVSEEIEPELRQRFPKHPQLVDDTMRFIRQLGGAPVYILVFQYAPSYALSDASIQQSIGAGIENILVAAAGKGIASCWLTAPVEVGKGEMLRDMFAPGKGPLKAVLTMGYAAGEVTAPARKEGRSAIL